MGHDARKAWLGSILWLCCACGDDEPAPSPGDAGPGDAVDAAGDGDSRDERTDGAPENEPADGCSGGTPAVRIASDVYALGISASGDELVFVDLSRGAVYLFEHLHTGAIRALKRDGSGERVLYTAPEMHQITWLYADGDTLYFPMTQPDLEGDRDRVTYLWRMGMAGGEPTLFAKPSDGGTFDEDARVFAHDEAALYVVNGEQVARVQKSDGSITLIAEVPDSPLVDLQLFDGKVWFRGFNPGNVYSAPADASEPSATPLSTDECLHSLSANRSGVYCGFARYDAQGELVYFDQDVPATLPNILSPPVAEDTVIAYGDGMYTLNLKTLSSSTLSCDAPFAADLVVTDDSVFVLTDSGSAYTEPASIYRVAR